MAEARVGSTARDNAAASHRDWSFGSQSCVRTHVKAGEIRRAQASRDINRRTMFRGLPPAIREKLVAGVLAARITVTAGLAVISGQMVATLATSAWGAMLFAVTASTTSFAVWHLSARIVPPTK